MAAADSQIVGAVLGGDTEAFGVLVDRYQERCFRLALHIVGSREDAEDAVQESFLRAYRYLGGYREREKFAAWLYRILVNQCRTTLARRQRRELPMAAWEWDARAAADAGGADQDALRDELARALDALTEDQREAVVLRYAEDLTYDEMSAVTGAGVSALKMRVQRACARLRELLLEKSHA
ncbi:MAG TPA: sigma-70 family RNA polymerase sigma factor [Gemmatimonadaceae bacterium]|jgi:RNA polymerase sigma-70 factor (ECF subfamily)|nr:sigma-70 family RNA polymerase sigma factor [Gemmatimonadaceae bacterium]